MPVQSVWVGYVLLNTIFVRGLNMFGIKTQQDYRNGDWHGNSTISARKIYNSVTYNLSELLTSFSIHYEYDSDWLTFTGDFDDLNFKEIGFIHFGRCFEVNLERKNKKEDIHKLRLIFKKPLLLFFIRPRQLLFLYSNAKFPLKLGATTFIDGNFI